MITSRRTFLRTFASLLAAPAIVKASSLMPVSVFDSSIIPPDFYYRTQFDDVVYWSGYEAIPVDRVMQGEPVRIIGGAFTKADIQRDVTPLVKPLRQLRREASEASLDEAIRRAIADPQPLPPQIKFENDVYSVDRLNDRLIVEKLDRRRRLGA